MIETTARNNSSRVSLRKSDGWCWWVLAFALGSVRNLPSPNRLHEKAAQLVYISGPADMSSKLTVFVLAIAAILVKLLTQFPIARGFVNGQITPDVVVTGFLMSLLVGLVGGAYPALRGASLPPTEALRYE